MAEHTPIRFGVLGARSFIANEAVLPAIEASTAAEVVAVASLSGPVPDRWSHLDVGRYEDVVDHPDVDAVYVPLPNGLHRDWVERCATAGKHVLCEKPLGVDVADAAAMVRACDDAGVLLAEAWMTPFDARWETAIGRARRGELGEVIDIDAAFTFTLGPEATDNYRWRPEQGGGALLDVGIYCLGPIVELWGAEPADVAATALWHATGVDARTEATLEWDDGRSARIRCSFVDTEEQRIELVGTSGSLVLEHDAHTGGHAAREIIVVDGDGRVTRSEVEPTDPYLGMVDAFARAVRGDDPWPRPMPDALALLALLERIGTASR